MSDRASLGNNDRPNSKYREFAPPPVLASHLVCTWTQSIGDGGTAYLQHVLPDGCVDIVWIGDAAAVIAGPATRLVVAPLPAGAIIVGARFRPGLAPCFLGLPASELLNTEIPLLELWGSAAERLFSQLAEQPAIEARRAILEAVLARRRTRTAPSDATVTATIGWLARHPSGHLGEFSRSIGISRRQLQRRFRAAVGYGPKTLQRILRFQRTLALARTAGGGRTSLAALAMEAGYADQAHMNREIRALAGRPPAALFPQAGSTLAMSDLFNTPGGLTE